MFVVFVCGGWFGFFFLPRNLVYNFFVSVAWSVFVLLGTAVLDSWFRLKGGSCELGSVHCILFWYLISFFSKQVVNASQGRNVAIRISAFTNTSFCAWVLKTFVPEICSSGMLAM